MGNFDLGRTTGSCFVYGDADTVLSTFRRSSYNEVNVMLQSPTAFDELVNAIKSNPQLQMRAEHEAELAEASEQQVNGVLNFVSYFVGAILAAGATTGAANSLYALVDSRRRQHATLLAIGFTGAPIVASRSRYGPDDGPLLVYQQPPSQLCLLTLYRYRVMSPTLKRELIL